MTARSLTALSTLCTACGLCCDGALFQFVSLTEEETTRLRPRGLEVRSESRGLSLQLRCHALDSGRCCQVYADRPGTCREFVCHLGRALVLERVTATNAHATVQQVHAEISALGALMHQGPTGSAVLPAARTALGKSGKPLSDAAIVQLQKTERLVREHFFGWT